ncbi:hypothetical protein [Microbacterium terrisoli]|uniref:hypothetical protein n=1 Tax=Microbacterium terrisoli TaxID=3242192 RepID=UPI00280615D2|nr:hypothetical protein [Microbacterium protaetiae]
MRANVEISDASVAMIRRVAREEQVTNSQALEIILARVRGVKNASLADLEFAAFIERLQSDRRRMNRLRYQRFEVPSWEAGKRRYDQKTEELRLMMTHEQKAAA